MERDFRDFSAEDFMPPAPPLELAANPTRRHYWRCASCDRVTLSEELIPAPESCACGGTVFATIWSAVFLG